MEIESIVPAQTWLWIRFYRLLAYKELCRILRWSTRAPFPLDPPSTLFEFLRGKCCSPLPFKFPVNSGHLPDIPQKNKIIMNKSCPLAIPERKFHCTTTSPSLQNVRYRKHFSRNKLIPIEHSSRFQSQ
jgi:hypothetical protein